MPIRRIDVSCFLTGLFSYSFYQVDIWEKVELALYSAVRFEDGDWVCDQFCMPIRGSVLNRICLVIVARLILTFEEGDVFTQSAYGRGRKFMLITSTGCLKQIVFCHAASQILIKDTYPRHAMN